MSNAPAVPVSGVIQQLIDFFTETQGSGSWVHKEGWMQLPELIINGQEECGHLIDNLFGITFIEQNVVGIALGDNGLIGNLHIN